MTALLCSIVAALFTAVGGMFALKHTDRLHLILSFSAGCCSVLHTTWVAKIPGTAGKSALAPCRSTASWMVRQSGSDSRHHRVSGLQSRLPY